MDTKRSSWTVMSACTRKSGVHLTDLHFVWAISVLFWRHHDREPSKVGGGLQARAGPFAQNPERQTEQPSPSTRDYRALSPLLPPPIPVLQSTFIANGINKLAPRLATPRASRFFHQYPSTIGIENEHNRKDQAYQPYTRVLQIKTIPRQNIPLPRTPQTTAASQASTITTWNRSYTTSDSR